MGSSPREDKARNIDYDFGDTQRRIQRGDYHWGDKAMTDSLNTYSRGAVTEGLNQATAGLNKYGTIANNNLMGAMNRGVGNAGAGAGAQSYAMGLTNPFHLVNRAKSQAAGQYADQFGNLNTELARQNYGIQSQFGGQLTELLAKNPQLAYGMSEDKIRNLLNTLQGRSNNAQNYGDMSWGDYALGGLSAGTKLMTGIGASGLGWTPLK